jgi:hypothetical protein
MPALERLGAEIVEPVLDASLYIIYMDFCRSGIGEAQDGKCSDEIS